MLFNFHLMKKIFVLALLLLPDIFCFGQQVGLNNSQIDTIVALHNFYRTVMGRDSLRWSPELASKAYQWLNDYVENPLISHNDYGYRQNLYVSTDTNVAYGVSFWAAEQIYYNPSVPDTELLTKHYLNIVSEKVKHIGCALIHSDTGMIYFVCFYD